MAVPLLGSMKRTFSYLNPIPEEEEEEEKVKEEADDGDVDGDGDGDEDEDEEEAVDAASSSAPLSVILSFKERLIFGSPDQSLLPWIDSIMEPCRNEGEEEKVPLHSAENLVDACRDGTGKEKPDVDFSHDSTVENQRIGSHRSGLRLILENLRSVEPPESPRLESVSSNKDTLLGFETDSHDTEEKKPYHHTIGMQEKSGVYSEYVPPVRKQLRRIRTAPAIATNTRRSSPKEKLDYALGSVPSPSMSVVSQAFVGLLLYLVVGIVIYSWRQDDFSGSSTHSFIDAIYFCIVTMCTIGYGDIAPVTPMAKMFSCAFVLVGFGFIDVLLSGMVTYVLDRQESLLLRSVASGRHDISKNYLVDTKKGRMRIRSKVALAFGVVIMCIGVGMIVMHFLENMGWLDSFYLSCMSVTTVGYGDHAFTTISGRLFASAWLLVSTLAVARSFIFLAEARIDKRHRLIAKFMLEKEMTARDLLAADLDNDGCVSKSDFVVYKLKQMGKIVEKDISEVCKQFNRLDIDNCGKITLSCLIRLHEASVPLKT